MSDYLATALVRVRADTRGFREQLRTDLKRSTGSLGVTKIPVKPELKAFRQEMERELRRQPLLIPVKPDMKGFREELLRRVKTSARGVTVRVPVEVAGGAVRPTQRPGVDEVGNINRVTDAKRRQVAVVKEEVVTSRAALVSDAARVRSQQSLGTSVERLSLAVKRSVSAESSVTQIKQRGIALDNLDLRSTTLLTQAINAENVALTENIRLLQGQIAAQRGLLPAQLAAAEANKKGSVEARKHASQQRFLTTGASSAGLSMLGVRGATLAANKAFLAGAAAVTIFSKTVLSAAQLETNLNVFAVTAGATADQLERAADLARELGGDITLPGVAAGDAAASFTNLAKAGLDVEDSLGAARGVLQLATAAEIENAQATELVASGLNAFGLAGREAVRVADLLTGSANESQGSITDMGIALQQSSAAARQAGLSIEDTVAILTLLARNGIRGSDAGTSFRTALLRLVRPTKAAADIIDQLNVNVRDAQGNVRPEVFADLGTALEGASRKQRDFALATIFGADAFRVAAIATREGIEGLNEIQVATQKQSLAAELSAARTAGFAGQIEALKNNLSVLGTTVGSDALGPLGDVAETLSEITLVVQDLSDQLEQLEASVPGRGLFDQLFGGFPVTGGDFIREVRSTIELGRRGVFVGGPSESAVERVERFNEELRSSFDNAQELQGLLAETEGPAEAIEVVKELSNELIGSSEDVREVREELEGVQRLILALGRAPTTIELEVFLEKGFIDDATIKKATAELKRNLAQAGKEGGDLLFNSLASTLSPDVFSDLAFGIVTGVREGVARAGPVTIQVAISLRQIEATRAGFAAKGVRAELSGDIQKQLELLRRDEGFLEQQIQDSIKSGNTQRRVNLEAELLQTRDRIQGILDGIVQEQEQRERDAKTKADEAKRAQEDAHRATLEAFNVRISQQQNIVLEKAATAWLSDDLRSNRRLQQILKEIIASGKLRSDELLDFRRQLIQAEADRKRILEDIRERRREERERVREGLSLDVQIAEATGNKVAEVKARENEIKAIEREIRHTRRGSLQRKRLILELRQKQAELRDLKKETQAANDAAKEMAFAFLQTQQGFAANLLSNMFGASLGAGTVGNVSPGSAAPGRSGGGGGGAGGAVVSARRKEPTPAQSVAERAGFAAGEGGGLTPSQATTLIHLTRSMLLQLQRLNKGNSHPENHRSQRRNGARMDVM